MATATDHATLAELNTAYVTSVQNGDVGWFGDNLGEDFVCSNPDGTLVAKRAFLAQTAQPVTITELTEEEVKIRLLGDVAIIHARDRKSVV